MASPTTITAAKRFSKVELAMPLSSKLRLARDLAARQWSDKNNPTPVWQDPDRDFPPHNDDLTPHRVFVDPTTGAFSHHPAPQRWSCTETRMPKYPALMQNRCWSDNDFANAERLPPLNFTTGPPSVFFVNLKFPEARLRGLDFAIGPKDRERAELERKHDILLMRYAFKKRLIYLDAVGKPNSKFVKMQLRRVHTRSSMDQCMGIDELGVHGFREGARTAHQPTAMPIGHQFCPRASSHFNGWTMSPEEFEASGDYGPIARLPPATVPRLIALINSVRAGFGQTDEVEVRDTDDDDPLPSQSIMGVSEEDFNDLESFMGDDFDQGEDCYAQSDEGFAEEVEGDAQQWD